MPPIVRSKLPDVGTTIFTVMSARAAEVGAINLSQGFPDFAVPEALREALARHVDAGQNQYAPMAGVLALREQVAASVLRHHGRRVDPVDEVTVVPGATEAIFCAIMASVMPGDEVILFDPAYDSYEPSVRMAGGSAVRIPLQPPAFRIDWQRVKEALGPRTRLIVINTPHNPTGSMLDAADLDALEELLSHSDALLLSDEVYEHLVYDGRRHLSVLSRPALAERAFAVFSFGKTFHATGWKTGYCVAPPALTTEFRRVHQFVTFVAVTPIQHALADFMRDHPEHIAGLGAFYQAKRDFFCDALEGSGWQGERASGSFFQLLDYSRIADVPDTEMAERLVRDHGVAAIPISVFYEHPPHLRLLRFCFAKQEQTLSRGAERLLVL
jgi:methionine aminotransferase